MQKMPYKIIYGPFSKKRLCPKLPAQSEIRWSYGISYVPPLKRLRGGHKPLPPLYPLLIQSTPVSYHALAEGGRDGSAQRTLEYKDEMCTQHQLSF